MDAGGSFNIIAIEPMFSVDVFVAPLVIDDLPELPLEPRAPPDFVVACD